MQGQAKKAEARRFNLLSDLLVLFKVRIVSLLLLSALGGLFISARGWPGAGPLSLVLVTGALTAMGSSAWNQYLEQQADALMARTRDRRPLVNGAFPRPFWVPFVATAMIVAPIAAVAPAHPALAFWLAAGAFIYIVIYTLWLKPRTPLNIVIGGAAGSAAVLAGAAATGSRLDLAPIALAIMLFFWTPIHFWSLALVHKEDYALANVPMLPVTTTPRRAAIWAFVHGAGATLSGLAISLAPGMGWPYAAPAGLATAILLWQGARLIIEPSKRRAWRLFHTSNIYLLIVLLAAVTAAIV